MTEPKTQTERAKDYYALRLGQICTGLLSFEQVMTNFAASEVQAATRGLREQLEAELIAVFKRNIAMHENSPVLSTHVYGSEVKNELRGFIRGLKRGLEIIEFDRTK
jgi:hypothetical protein